MIIGLSLSRPTKINKYLWFTTWIYCISWHETDNFLLEPSNKTKSFQAVTWFLFDEIPTRTLAFLSISEANSLQFYRTDHNFPALKGVVNHKTSCWQLNENKTLIDKTFLVLWSHKKIVLKQPQIHFSLKLTAVCHSSSVSNEFVFFQLLRKSDDSELSKSATVPLTELTTKLQKVIFAFCSLRIGFGIMDTTPLPEVLPSDIIQSKHVTGTLRRLRHPNAGTKRGKLCAWVSKVIRICFGFALLLAPISHPIKLIATRSFSRALPRLPDSLYYVYITLFSLF